MRLGRLYGNIFGDLDQGTYMLLFGLDWIMEVRPGSDLGLWWLKIVTVQLWQWGRKKEIKQLEVRFPALFSRINTEMGKDSMWRVIRSQASSGA